MSEQQATPSFAEYLTVSEAAEFLGVSPWTLRNWDKAGRLKPTRHPKNGYRIYRHEDLAAVLESAAAPAHKSTSRESEWRDIGPREHFVQFYESDDFLASSVAEYLSAGLLAGEAAVVVATESHRREIERQLQARGCDTVAASANGSFVSFDARETLDRFMLRGAIDPRAFDDVVGKAMASITSDTRPVRAFGEMVVLLWMDGKRQAAIQLEELWNTLGQSHSFSLCCGYPMHAFSTSAEAQLLHDVCACHSRVMPAESYAALSDSDAKSRAITALQHKARSLEAEIAHRQAVERELSRAREAAEHACKGNGQFLAELNRELSASMTSVAALQTDPALPPHLHREVAIIRRRIETVRTMIKQATQGAVA